MFQKIQCALSSAIAFMATMFVAYSSFADPAPLPPVTCEECAQYNCFDCDKNKLLSRGHDGIGHTMSCSRCKTLKCDNVYKKRCDDILEHKCLTCFGKYYSCDSQKWDDNIPEVLTKRIGGITTSEGCHEKNFRDKCDKKYDYQSLCNAGKEFDDACFQYYNCRHKEWNPNFVIAVYSYKGNEDKVEPPLKDCIQHADWISVQNNYAQKCDEQAKAKAAQPEEKAEQCKTCLYRPCYLCPSRTPINAESCSACQGTCSDEDVQKYCNALFPPEKQNDANGAPAGTAEPQRPSTGK